VGVQLSTSDAQDGRQTSAFALADHLAAKADPGLIARDQQHFRGDQAHA
jgi:hypothetical protein